MQGIRGRCSGGGGEEDDGKSEYPSHYRFRIKVRRRHRELVALHRWLMAEERGERELPV